MSEIDQLQKVAIEICKSTERDLVDAAGSGVFKATYLVRNKDGVSKALKVYNSNNINVRVEREVEAMSRCDHPNIANFEHLSTYDLDGTTYLYSVEEYISGGTLEARLATGLLARGDAFAIGKNLIDAISHIAGLDLVHRDLKPANIMLRETDESPVIVDFGLVRNLDATSLTESWIPQGPGTPLYAPPEQLNNDKELIDWRADQFALAVVLTKSISGRHPYEEDGEQPIHVVERVSARAPAPNWFPEWANDQNLAPLVRMAKPWPVQRYRLPTDLADAWQSGE